MSVLADSPQPLVFPVAQTPPAFAALASNITGDRLTLRTTARALTGMQKEAVVNYGPTGTSWRMVCDEGPYLNGTDLAPFPLAFFCIGMVSSYMSEVLVLLKQRNIAFSDMRLLQDNRYSMEGSAIAGTMTGSALPVQLQLEINSNASAAVLQQIVMDAVAASPVGALLRQTLVSDFSITLNGVTLQPRRVHMTKAPVPPAPAAFAEIQPLDASTFPSDIIIKTNSAQSIAGVSGGAGSSLADSQKRVLHMRGICSLREDGMKEIVVELYQPIGSRFRFLADDSRAFGGKERAPCGLAYASAGLAFCYMTQLGRYSHIVKKPLDACYLIQDTCFSRPGASGGTGKLASASPVTTHVYLQSHEDAEYARTLVDMSEQTCFLHAACREQVAVTLKSID